MNNTMEYCNVESVYRFKTHYVRNNRRSTEKNLRCFPCCNADGHVTQGFCGRGCLFRVTLLNNIHNNQPFHLNQLSCVVELTMCEEIPENQPLVGQLYDRKEISSRLKEGKSEPWTKPYWQGKQSPVTIETNNDVSKCNESNSGGSGGNIQTSNNQIDFVFSPTHWHYGWRSNKHTNKSRHTCRVYVFAKVNDEQFLCISSVSDGAFTISSTKKRQPEVPPGQRAAPVGANALPGYSKKKRGRKGSSSSKSNCESVAPTPNKKNKNKTTIAEVVAPSTSSSTMGGLLNFQYDQKMPVDSVAGISDAFRVLSSMGLPSGGLDETDNNWNSKRLDQLAVDHDGDIGMDDMVASFDVGNNSVRSNSATSNDKRDSLDKFSFDADILDNYENINIEAAAASAISEDGQRRSRIRSRTQMEMDEDDISSDGSNDTTTPSTSSNPGSVSPVTSHVRERPEQMYDSQNGDKKMTDSFSFHKPISGGGGGGGGGGGNGVEGGSISRIPIRSFSQRSSINSNASANSFLGAFDSFEGDEESDAVNERVVVDGLDHLYNGEEEETFMTFEKINEQRLQSTSGEGSTLMMNAKLMKEPLILNATPPTDKLASEVKEQEKVIDNSNKKLGTNESSSSRSTISNNSRSESNVNILAAALNADSSSGGGSSSVTEETTGTVVGMELSRSEEEIQQQQSSSFSRWIINNWRSPRFICFILSVMFALTFIVFTFTLLIKGQKSSDAGSGKDDEISRRLYLRLRE